MNYNFHHTNQYELDECISKGICSISPVLASLHEVIMLHLRELAFYLLELKEVGAHNAKLKEQVIDIISSLIVDVEYSPEHLKVILDRLHDGLYQAKALYEEMCKRKGVEPIVKAHALKKEKKFSYAELIREGQKEYRIQNKKFSKDEKHFLEELFMLIKSICIHLVELKSYGFDDNEIYYSILELLKLMNSPQQFVKEQHEVVKKFVDLDHFLLKEIYEKRKEKYGEITPVDLSFSIRPNKAVLVVGDNLVELEEVLKAAAEKGVDVYTYGKMIMAHTYPKLRQYPNLVGHFGKGTEFGLVDLAAFPGSIFLTRLALQRVERLYRSRIFTSDTVAPPGVITIKNKDYQPLIEAALSDKGFVHPQTKPTAKIGFSEKEMLAKIAEVAEKMEKGEIKHFFAIGVANGTNSQREYFEKFLELVPEDCFVLSFSYTNEADNVLLIPSDIGFAVLYKALDILSSKTKLSDLNLSVLYTRCEHRTISNLLNMKNLGIKDIYFPLCSPNLIRPELLERIRETYKINNYTNPKTDIQKMLSGDGAD